MRASISAQISGISHSSPSAPITDDTRRITDDLDPELLAGPWTPCELQPPPADWAAALPDGTEAREVFGFDGAGAPTSWPLPYSYAGFSAAVDTAKLAPGKYEMRARSVDAMGHAQPEPRPSQKNGKNGIGVRVVVVG